MAKAGAKETAERASQRADNPVIRGFCTNKDQEEALVKYGLEPKVVWMEGRGAEDFARCVSTYRGRPGLLIVAHDLRVLGRRQKVVANAMAHLEKANIKIVDISHPEDTTSAALLQRAGTAILSGRFPDRRIAKRRGARGGLARGENAKSARCQIDTDTLIRNLVREYKRITWPVIIRILDGKISEATLRRHYMTKVGKDA